MRDYQRIKNNRYVLPRSVYHRSIWSIRDYDRMKDFVNNVIDCSPNYNDGMPKNRGISDKVADIAIKRCDIMREIKIIDEALKTIPVDYRNNVWDNIQYSKPYPKNADRTTYGRYKSKFIFEVARRLKII